MDEILQMIASRTSASATWYALVREVKETGRQVSTGNNFKI